MRLWLVVPAGLSLLAALAGPSAWRRSLGWLTLGLAGYAASLSLVVAGTGVRYQHYLTPAKLAESGSRLALALVAVELLTVAVGLWHRRRDLAELLPDRWRGWRLAALLGTLILTSATLSRDPGVYAAELLGAGLMALAHLGAAVLAALALPADHASRLGDRLSGWLASDRGPELAVRFAACATTVLAAALAFGVYQQHPHVPDEVVYLFHARYFAAGELGMPLPRPAEAFDIDLMFTAGNRWFSPVPPGWPAMLSAGVWLGIPWLINPLLAGLNILLTPRVLEPFTDRPTARVGALLLALSPWHLFLAMSLLPHTFSLSCALLAAVAVARWRSSDRLGWAVAGGLATGVTSLIRPLEGLAIAVLLGLWSLSGARWSRRFAGGLAYTLGTALTGALTLPYNAALMGSASRFPIMAYTDQLYGPGTNALGFGPNRGLGWSGLDPFPGHGPLDVVVNANFNFFSLNLELLGWASGSLLLLAAWLLHWRLRRGDRLLLAAIASVIGLHCFYWFSGGPDFGARYWFLIIVPALGLSARAFTAVAATGDRPAGRSLVAVLALGLGGMLVFVPWRAADKYYHYRGMRPDIPVLAERHHFGRSLVLIRGRRHPDFASAAVYNPLHLDADAPVYAWDRTPELRAELVERYPDRPIWIVDGPTLTADGFLLVAGPLPPGRVPSEAP